MKNVKFLEKRSFILPLYIMLLMTASSQISAKEEMFNAYPGKYSATFVNVDKTNSILLIVAVWDGFPKKIRITLPNIKIPVMHSKSKSCEIKLANEGNSFTKEYFAKAKNIKVSDIRMERTDMIDGVSSISSDQGILASMLMQNGFARSSSIADNIPWC